MFYTTTIVSLYGDTDIVMLGTQKAISFEEEIAFDGNFSIKI
jgi:hypothetical protein